MTSKPRAALEDLAAGLLEAARSEGAASADVFLKESVSCEARVPALASGRSIERGIALRFFDAEGRSSLVAATLPGEEDDPGASRQGTSLVPSLARRAAEAAAHASPRPARSLPDAWTADGRGLGLYDPDIEKGPSDLLQTAEEIRTHALESAADHSADVRLFAVSSTVLLLNTAGFKGTYRQTLARLDLTLGRRRDGVSAAARIVRAARSLRGLAADTAVGEGIDLIEERLAPKLPPSGIHPVVLAPRAAAEIVAAIAAWLTRGGRGPEGSDRRAGPERGEKIGAQALALLDDGRLPGGVASAPFDGEGTRTRRTVAVERGVVREFLRDIDSASDGEPSTGNGVRASFREAPSLRPSNFFVKPGATAPSEMIGSIRQGIRITTLGRIPPLRGPESAFAVPFTGRWIENGRTGSPLGGGYLAGTAKEILAEIEGIGSDLAFFHRGGSFGAPSLLIRRAPIRSS